MYECSTSVSLVHYYELTQYCHPGNTSKAIVVLAAYTVESCLHTW
jgi:hypothetical protein